MRLTLPTREQQEPRHIAHCLRGPRRSAHVCKMNTGQMDTANEMA